MAIKVWIEGEKLLADDLNNNFAQYIDRFGGTGADGALSISSGTTTVNLGGARVVILNYSSISITGTGKLAFSNKHADGTIVIIKCKNDCTLTSSQAPMIDCSGLGADGGASGTQNASGSNTWGGNGSDGKTYGFVQSKGASQITGGAAATFAFMAGVTAFHKIVGKYPKIFLGAGGAAGNASWSANGSGTVVSGAGGAGGGCLIMEVRGTLNFTTANGISVAGAPGGNGSTTGTTKICFAAGGGGGGGGSCFILYNALTAFSGTVNVAGGVGGNAKVETAPTLGGQGGGSGGSGINAGANGSTVSNGSSSDGQKTGADGGAGLAMNDLNTEFY